MFSLWREFLKVWICSASVISTPVLFLLFLPWNILLIWGSLVSLYPTWRSNGDPNNQTTETLEGSSIDRVLFLSAITILDLCCGFITLEWPIHHLQQFSNIKLTPKNWPSHCQMGRLMPFFLLEEFEIRCYGKNTIIVLPKCTGHCVYFSRSVCTHPWLQPKMLPVSLKEQVSKLLRTSETNAFLSISFSTWPVVNFEI